MLDMMNKFTQKHLLRCSFYKEAIISLSVVNYMEVLIQILSDIWKSYRPPKNKGQQ